MRTGLLTALVSLILLASPASAGAPTPPVAPSGFAGITQSSTSIRWVWTDNSGNENGFAIAVGTTVLSMLPPNTTTWLQTGLTANKSTGPMVVAAYNGQGYTTSAGVSTWTFANPPAGFQIATRSSTTATLAWTANGNPGATRYELERSVSAGPFTFVASTTATGYLQLSLTPLTSYSWRARALNGAGAASAYGATASTTTAAPDPPGAPSAFAGTALDTARIQWAWADNSSNESGFRVLSGTTNVSGDLAAGTTYWVQTGLSPNASVGPLRVQSFNGGGTGSSGTASRATPAAVPSSLGVTAVSSITVTIAWAANGNSAATAYELEFLSTTTASSYTDAGLLPSTTHSYRVRARNSEGIVTAYAGPVSTTTLAPDPPAAPSAFSGTALSTAQIRWSWTDNSSNETGFRVLSGTTNLSGDLAAGTSSWLQSGLTPNASAGPLVVQAFNGGGASGSAAASRATLSAAPASLAVVGVTSTTVSLSWSANGNSAGTSYEVESLSTTTAASFTETGLLPSTTHSYRVRAVNADGVATAYAGPVSTTTLAPDAPAAPTGLAGTSPSTTQLLWTWSDASSNEAGFRVLSGTTSVSGDLPAGTTSWLQAGLSPNSLVGPLVVQAFNGGGAAGSSAAVRYTLAAPPTALAASSVSSMSVSLGWSANGNPAGTVFEIESVSTTTATSYTHADLSPSSAYGYRVRALNGDGIASAYDGPVSTTTAAPDAPATPTGLAAAALSTTQILWSWADNSSDEQGFRVLSGTVNVSGDLPAGTTTWLQAGLSPNALEGPFRVEAFNPTVSLDSNAASRRTLAAVPASLAVGAVSSTTVSLSWSANGDPAGTVYELEGLSTTTATSFTETGLAPSTALSYRVRARNGDGVSTAWAGPASTTTLAPDAPLAPSGLSATARSSSELLWTWTDSSYNETGLRVLSGATNVSGDLAAGTTYWLQSGVPANTLIGPFHVEAFNAGGTGSSGLASTRTLAALPVGLAVGSVSSTTVSIGWGANGNPLGTVYELESLSTTTALSFTETGLPPSTTHGYRVRALNDDGVPTAWAGPVSTTSAAPDAPGAPAGLAAAALSTTRLRWTWSDNSSNELGYRVLSGTVNVSGDLPADTTSWLQSGLSTNTLAGPLVVQAFNGGGTMDSNAASRRTLAAAPAALAVVNVSSITVSLGWSANGDPAGTVFELELLSSTTATSYLDAGLSPSTTYAYRVRAVNGDGAPTAWTGPVSTTTLPADPVATVRAILSSPAAGETVGGSRVTLLARLTLGAQQDVKWVRFQYKPSTATVWADVVSPVASQQNPDPTSPYFMQWDASGLALGSYDLRALAYDNAGAPDPFPPASTVAVAWAGGASVFETTEAGGKRLDQAVQPGVASTLVSGSPSSTQLTILRLPAGAVSAPGLLTLRLKNAAGPSAAAPAGDVIELDLSGNPADLPVGAPATVTIVYPDENGDGVVDGTPWRASQLRLMSLSPAGTWSASPASVDETAHTVSGTLWSLRGFALFAPQASALDGVRIFPMPFKPHAGNPAFGAPFSPGNPNSGVIFDSLPPGARIKIYTVTGRRVRTLEANGAGRAQWDVKNDGGDDVASGGYLAVIEAAGQDDITRKLLIIK